ncbi:DsbA family protein [Pseudaminobacter sp. 19-2017]|uniref:DsbA family protein n=1 Tax=Pseudaminobacter soli (ex Zhang et al. 2022) TaxID=2831468 RepID=A0A942E6H0_9HYPH|nr:DsbA family protein [Pseudaminobacter soli]MBS3652165.1 DsbA family protein [Pseudaminobacter soli]
MNKAILLGTTGLAAAFAMLAIGFAAGKTGTASDDPPRPQIVAEAGLDRGKVEQIVRDYLLANPEVMLEVQTALEDKQKQELQLAALKVIDDSKNEIFNSVHDGVVGNPNGKITIVEFYDYNCGFCKRALQDMVDLTKSNPDLRFVLKEFPILGPDSQKAHMVSQAFLKLMPDKYGEFHNALLGGQGRATEESAIRLAVSLGANEAQLRDAMNDPQIRETFASTYELANRLSITGTPSYVVGKEVVYGALGRDVLAERIAEATACLEASC